MQIDKKPLWLAALVIASMAVAPAAQAGPYLLIEADSGRVIAESDAGQPWYPASVTKLMTAYLTFRAMREGRVGPHTVLTFSSNAHAQPPSKMGFPIGTEVTVDNALKMLMVRSANDVAVMVAEGIGGSVEQFAREMNATAARLGMTATRFTNPHGLPDENQVTTARDVAILAQAILREFPEYEMYFRIPAIQYGKRVMRNHNRLIDRYAGADGMKTGFICSSGFNVVATATRNGRRLIAVVFGAYSADQRTEDSARLLERGFHRTVSLAELFGHQSPTVRMISNRAGTPVDLRPVLCNPNRKRPAAESSIDEGEIGPIPVSAQELLADLPRSVPPIRVFTGPPPRTPPVRLVAPSSDKPSAGAEGARTAAAAVAPSAGTGRMPARVPTPRPRPSI